MPEVKLRIVNQLGLHARAAAQLVRLASKYESRIMLVRSDNASSADAKSILSVLTLAAARGTEICLDVEGEDETAALEAVQTLFADGFGEL